MGLALDGGGRWAAFAITWLEDGFPVAGQTDALRRVITDKKKNVAQRPRQTAARLLAAQDRHAAEASPGQPALAPIEAGAGSRSLSPRRARRL